MACLISVLQADGLITWWPLPTCAKGEVEKPSDGVGEMCSNRRKCEMATFSLQMRIRVLVIDKTSWASLTESQPIFYASP